MTERLKPEDILNTHGDMVKQNYCGEYKPEEFWHDFGKIYLSTFSENGLKLDVQPLISRLHALEPKPESVLEVGCGFAPAHILPPEYSLTIPLVML